MTVEEQTSVVEEQFEKYIEELEDRISDRPVPLREDYDRQQGPAVTEKETRGNMVFEYDRQAYRSQRSISELVLRDNTVGRIYPGSLLKARPLIEQSRLDLLALKEPPRSIVTLSSGIDETLKSIVHNGTFSDYIAKISPVIQSIQDGDVRIEYKTHYGKSLQSVLLRANLALDGWGAEINASVSKSEKKEKSFALISLDQVYFTAIAEPEERGSYLTQELFENQVNRDTLIKSLKRSGEPVVVQSVTYGRRLVVTLESDSSEEDLEAALAFKYNSGTGEVSGDISAENRETLARTRINASVIGGVANAALIRAISSSPVDLRKNINDFIANTIKISPDIDAAPVSFTADYAFDRAQASSNLFADFSGYVPRGSYPPINRITDKLLMDKNNKDDLSVGGDKEIDSDDWTYTRIQYELQILNTRHLALNIVYEAREGNKDKSFGDTRFIISKTIGTENASEPWGPFDRPIKSFSVDTRKQKEHWHKGKKHGFQPFPSFGPLKNIEVSFDKSGRNDDDAFKLKADIDFTVTIGS